MSHQQWETWRLLSRCAPKVRQQPTPGCASAPPTAERCSLHQGSNHAGLGGKSTPSVTSTAQKAARIPHGGDPKTGLEASPGVSLLFWLCEHPGKCWAHSLVLVWPLEMDIEARLEPQSWDVNSKLDGDSMTH